MSQPGHAVRLTATVVGFVYALALHLSGLSLDSDIKRALAYLPTVLVLAVVAYDRWLWKWPGIRRLHQRPRLDGLWKVVLRPDRKSLIPADGNWGPIAGYMVVEQSYWSISLTQFTKESASYSKAASFLKRGESGKQTLVFVYDNQPDREHLHGSPRSTGGCELQVANGSPTSMAGSYFSDRFTAGAMDLMFLDRTTNYVTFAQADAHVDA